MYVANYKHLNRSTFFTFNFFDLNNPVIVYTDILFDIRCAFLFSYTFVVCVTNSSHNVIYVEKFTKWHVAKFEDIGVTFRQSEYILFLQLKDMSIVFNLKIYP